MTPGGDIDDLAGRGAGRQRILMIGLDAAEPRLVERWTGDGSLPHLAALLDRGSYGRLLSTAELLLGSSWPTFYTGMTPAAAAIDVQLVYAPARDLLLRPVAHPPAETRAGAAGITGPRGS